MKYLRLIKNNSKNLTYLLLDKKKFNCNVGKNGIGLKTREGDLITPKGIYILKKVFFRSDRIQRPRTCLSLKKIEKFDYWCVDSKSKNYNMLITKNKKYKSENLYRKDSLYDIVIEISFNSFPRKKNKGSAIFIHCSFSDNRKTSGCIALKKNHLILLLKNLNSKTYIKVQN